MHPFHRGIGWQPLTRQPDPLVEQAKIVSIALQQSMTCGGGSPKQQEDGQAGEAQAAGWVGLGVQAAMLEFVELPISFRLWSDSTLEVLMSYRISSLIGTR